MATAATSIAANAAPSRSPTLGRFLHNKFVRPKQDDSRTSTARPRLPKSVRNFVPGPWTVHLLLLTHPGMLPKRALRLTKQINRANATARLPAGGLQTPTIAHAVGEVTGGGA